MRNPFGVDDMGLFVLIVAVLTVALGAAILGSLVALVWFMG